MYFSYLSLFFKNTQTGEKIEKRLRFHFNELWDLGNASLKHQQLTVPHRQDFFMEETEAVASATDVCEPYHVQLPIF